MIQFSKVKGGGLKQGLVLRYQVGGGGEGGLAPPPPNLHRQA